MNFAPFCGYRNLIVGVSNYFGSSSVSSFEYQNDAIGRRTERLDFDENLFAITNSFAYNHYSEVTNAIINTDNYNFTFDDIGNREKFEINTTSVDYENSQLNQSLEANSLNPAYDKSFAFDLDGNMLTNGDWTYTWNGENRMVSATNTVDDTYITYDYDYQGRMIKKITDAETTLFYWNGVNIIAELTTQLSNSLTNYYTWSQGETLTASLDGDTVFYYHDANKNVTDLLDDSGDSVGHYEYSPFGVITEQSGSLAETNPFRFSNEYFDDDIQKVVFKLRILDPWLGKFLSRDPIGVQGGLNVYGVCGNDLINKFDFLGLVIFDFDPKNAKNAPWYWHDFGVGDSTFGLAEMINDEILSWKCSNECGLRFTVTLKFKILITERFKTTDQLSDLNGLTNSKKGTYGHEQRHILANHNYWKGIAPTALEPHEKKYSSIKECEEAAGKATRDAFEDFVLGFSLKDIGHNELTPALKKRLIRWGITIPPGWEDVPGNREYPPIDGDMPPVSTASPTLPEQTL